MYNLLYNMDMALHIADGEVSTLVSELAEREGTSKTEALRRLLRKTLAERQKQEKRGDFRAFAANLMLTARRQNVAPATKQEMDDLWGSSESSGD